MAGRSKSDDAKRRKEAAESLQHQIDELVSGGAQPQGPRSFRDFIEEKMAEDRKKGNVSPKPKKEKQRKSDPSS